MFLLAVGNWPGLFWNVFWELGIAVLRWRMWHNFWISTCHPHHSVGSLLVMMVWKTRKSGIVSTRALIAPECTCALASKHSKKRYSTTLQDQIDRTWLYSLALLVELWRSYFWSRLLSCRVGFSNSGGRTTTCVVLGKSPGGPSGLQQLWDARIKRQLHRDMDWKQWLLIARFVCQHMRGETSELCCDFDPSGLTRPLPGLSKRQLVRLHLAFGFQCGGMPLGTIRADCRPSSLELSSPAISDKFIEVPGSPSL